MDSHPTPEDTLVAIEVADSTLEGDRQIKLPKYAQAGVPEFWLVDLVNNRIEVHALPNEGVYQEVRIILRHQNIISRALPHLKLKASDILG
jgi:Uma2 family endonuclease